MSQQSVVLKFEDPSGVPLANGRVEVWLMNDIGSGGIQIAAGRKLNIPLNSSGQCTVTLYVNSSLQPVGSRYQARAYTSNGLPCWDGSFTVS